MTGVARMTIEKLLRDLGTACVAYQDMALRWLACKRFQCDEAWSFVYAKEKNVPADERKLVMVSPIELPRPGTAEPR